MSRVGQYGERVMELLAAEGPHPLLMIDEFPIMLEEISGRDPAEARQLLRWFRAARTAPNTSVRFVIGGSINLESTLVGMGLVDTINDLQLVRLGPFSRETAQQFIEAVFSERERTLAPAVRDAILDLVGEPIPYILTVLLTAIFDRAGAKPDPIDTDMIRAAFEEDVLGGATSAVFQHYRTRIDRFYIGGEASAAKAILRLLSRAEQPVSRSTLYAAYLQAASGTHSESAEDDFSRLMGKLDNDFYIHSLNSSYAFFSRVLQLWWRAQYGYQE